jgi:hypothetical protein
MPNLLNEYKNISKQIDSYTTYLNSVQASDTARAQAQIFFDKKVSDVKNAINVFDSVNNLKKNRTPSLFDQLIGFIKKLDGEGADTNNKLLKTFSDIVVKNLPEIKKILSEEAIKLLGCRDEQTFPAIKLVDFESANFIVPIESQIYIPLKNLDLWKNIKKDPDSTAGIFFYENLGGVDILDGINNNKYKNFGGDLRFPFNRELYARVINPNESFYQKYDETYQGGSTAPLFDFKYVTENNLGEIGDFIAVTLLSKDDEFNLYSKFIFDYYDSINIFDFNNLVKNIFNYLLDGADITQSSSPKEIGDKTKFMLLIERLCGKCFDNSDEIDVSGIAKIAELDDDSDDFFTFSEIDLRQIDENVNNYMNKIVSYESCGVVNQPIDYDGIVDYAKEVVGGFDALSPTAQSDALTNAILNILKNNNLTNNNTTLFSFVKSIVESILTPKVLFPIMALGQVIEKTATAQYELVRGRADEFITQNNKAIKNFTDEGIDSAESFAKKYKAYLQNVTRRVLELFLKELFNTLKGKLKKLVSRVVGGVFKNYSKKQVQVILALSTGLLGIIATITNFRKCKSVIESIGKILNSINILTKAAIIPIPPPLLIGAQFLPGFSNERAKINVIAEMQSLGLPTEDLLDGTPNRVLLFAEAVINGTDNEEITNGAVDGFIDPLLTGRVFAKKRHG